METTKPDLTMFPRLTAAEFCDMRRLATNWAAREYYGKLFERLLLATPQQLLAVESLLPTPPEGKQVDVHARHRAKLTADRPAFSGIKLPLGLVQSMAELVRQESNAEAEHQGVQRLLEYVEQEATRYPANILAELYGPAAK